jgi:hypothetical protein
MARPTARIIETLDELDIMAVQGIWCLTYDDEIVSSRRRNPSVSQGQTKHYSKVAYPNEASARMQARRLNLRYNTDLFAVICLYQAEKLDFMVNTGAN